MVVTYDSSVAGAGNLPGNPVRWNTTASAGVRWPCRITNRELYHW